MGRFVLYLCGALIAFFLILPIFIVVPISFSSAKYLTFPPPGFSLQWYQNYLGRKQWMDATWLSLQVGVLTALLATAFGTMAALVLARRRFPGRGLVYALILSPMILPVIITAIAIYRLYASVHLIGSKWALVLAHTVLAIPVVVIPVMASLRGLDPSLEHAAMVLGASPLTTFLRVTVPLIRPGILSGALFAFITSFDELVVTIFIAGSTAITLTKQMWDGIRTEIDPTIAAVSTLLIALTVLVLGLLSLLQTQGRRLASRAPAARERAPDLAG